MSFGPNHAFRAYHRRRRRDVVSTFEMEIHVHGVQPCAEAGGNDNDPSRIGNDGFQRDLGGSSTRSKGLCECQSIGRSAS